MLAGGLLIELVLTALSVPFIYYGRDAELPLAVPPATLLAALAFGAWAARGTARPLLHGALAGAGRPVRLPAAPASPRAT